MGLFGGFKAKFKGNQSKKPKQNEVVCVKYKTFSEFDEPSQSTSNINGYYNKTIVQPVSKNEVVKERKSAPKPEVKNLFQNGQAKLLPVDIESDKNVVFSKIGESSNKKKEIVEVRQPEHHKEPANNFKPVELPEIKKIEDVEKPEISEESKISQPNSSSSLAADNSSTSTALIDDIENNIYEESDKYSVHLAKHDMNNINSSDEESENEVEESDHESVLNNYRISFPPESPMQFSSQAENIFFGGGDELEVSRPRRFVIDDDDNDNQSQGSSASA